MPSYASKTKGTITLNHCPQTIHHTFILGGDEVGEMTFIFKQHSEGQRWKVGSERQVCSLHCTSRPKQWGRFHVNCKSSLERTTSSSTLRSTTLSVSAVLYSAYTFTTVRPSPCWRLDARPNQPLKRCQERIYITRVCPSSGQTAEVTPIRPRRRPPLQPQKYYDQDRMPAMC